MQIDQLPETPDNRREEPIEKGSPPGIDLELRSDAILDPLVSGHQHEGKVKGHKTGTPKFVLFAFRFVFGSFRFGQNLPLTRRFGARVPRSWVPSWPSPFCSIQTVMCDMVI